MLERKSAIASGLARGSRPIRGQIEVRLGEIRGWSLLQLAGFPKGLGAVEQTLATVCGVAVPAEVGEVARSAGTLLMRTGPEQIWIVGSGEVFGGEQAIRSGVAPAAGVVTPLSHSRTRMVVEGTRAREVLAKGIAIDLLPDKFAVDRFAMTGLDHTPVVLHRAAGDRYEVYAMRTFALTVWDWLTDAALEFGYEVVS